MLVLTREVGQSILTGINCEIEVFVAGISGDRVEVHASWRTGGRLSSEILSRIMGRGESLDLGAGATCTIYDVRNDKIKLGITAPKEYAIHRREVWEAIHRHRDDDTSAD